jgi:hypothetical protein
LNVYAQHFKKIHLVQLGYPCPIHGICACMHPFPFHITFTFSSTCDCLSPTQRCAHFCNVIEEYLIQHIFSSTIWGAFWKMECLPQWEFCFFEMPCIIFLLVPRMMDLTTPLKSGKDLMPLRAKALPPMPHDLHMFKFIIMFILHFTICKAHIGGGHSQNVGARLCYHVILGPLFWGYPQLWPSPYIKC